MTTSLEQFFDVEDDHDIRVKEFVDNMNLLKSMSVEESTLYKKWESVNFNYNLELANLRLVKNKIWKPIDLFDKEKTIAQIQALKPKVVFVDDGQLLEDWNALRQFISTGVFDQNIGRNLKFLVIDEPTGAYLGILNAASDVMSIKVRDAYIGWDKKSKIGAKKINNTAIGSCIVATQPFGYNFLGGKLMACLVTSKAVRDEWEKRYEDKIVGFTTTSLYGGYSMYNSIPYWKDCGNSAGKISVKPDDKVYRYWLDYVKLKYADEYKNIYHADNAVGVASGVKQRILGMIFKEVGLIKSHFEHGYQRGVYFCSIYENTKEYLQNKIGYGDLKMTERYTKDVDGMLDWWRAKAIKRYEKLHADGKLTTETLFYDDLIGMTWKETKAKYLEQVGR